MTLEEAKKILVKCPEDAENCDTCSIKEICGAVPVVFNHILYLEALLEATKLRWADPNELLPNVGDKVLVCGVRGGIQAGVYRGTYRSKHKWHWKKNSQLDVVGWMPQEELPKPPKEEHHAD